jgi:hypothetical protein
MIIGKLILKLAVQGENLDALKQFESGAKAGDKAARGAAVGTQKLERSKKTLAQSVRQCTKDLAKFRMHVIFTTTALTGLSIYASKTAAELRRFEMNTGLSAQKLQEWQQQAALSGVSADEMADSLTGLQKAVTEIKLGAGNISPFAMLGVDPHSDPFAILTQLQTKLKSFNPALGTTLATQMGLSDNVIAFLREMQGIEPSDKGLILTKDEISRLKEFNIYFNRIWDNIKRTAQKVGGLLSPIAHEVLWVADRFRKAFMTVAEFIMGLVPKLGPFKIAIISVGIALAAAMFPATAAIAGVLLALEDLATFSRGGNSAIGAVIGWFQDWRRILQDVILALATIVYTVETLSGLTLFRYMIAKTTGGKMSEGLGDQIANFVTTGAMGAYNDSQMAAMKDGKAILRPYGDNSSSSSTTNNITINGVSTPERLVKVLQKYSVVPMNQSVVPEGSGK